MDVCVTESLCSTPDAVNQLYSNVKTQPFKKVLEKKIPFGMVLTCDPSGLKWVDGWWTRVWNCMMQAYYKI